MGEALRGCPLRACSEPPRLNGTKKLATNEVGDPTEEGRIPAGAGRASMAMVVMVVLLRCDRQIQNGAGEEPFSEVVETASSTHQFVAARVCLNSPVLTFHGGIAATLQRARQGFRFCHNLLV